MVSLAHQLVQLLIQRGHTVATCESLTGGLVAAAITDVPGASACFRGGVIAYHPDIKIDVVGIDPDLIAHQGVVSSQTAAGMALGARRVCGSDWAIATTGVAGPSEIEGQPAGTVWLGIAGDRDGVAGTYTRLMRFDGDRDSVRREAVNAALSLLIEKVSLGE